MTTFKIILFTGLVLSILSEVLAQYVISYSFGWNNFFECTWTICFSICLIATYLASPSKKIRSKKITFKVLTDFDEFRLSILVPIVCCFLYSVLLLKGGFIADSDLSPSSILEHFKVPLALLSTSIPLTALFTATHRSRQTATQIEVQQEQNNFTNHFKHLEEFKKAFEEHNLPVPWTSSEEFHLDIYPETKVGRLSPSLLTEKPKEILTELFEQIYLHPFSAREICNDHYKHLVERITLKPVQLSYDIRPTDFIELFDSLNKAYSFAALHHPRLRYSKEIVNKAEQLTDLLCDVTYVVKNKSTLLENLRLDRTNPLLQKIDKNTPYLKRLKLHRASDDYLLLAVAQAWKSILSDLDDVEKEKLLFSLPQDSQRFICNHIEPSYKLGLKDLIRESNRLSVTKQAR